MSDNHAIDNARGWLETIRDLMDRLDKVGDDASAHDAIRVEIEQGPLSVMVRDGWRFPGATTRNDEGPEEFEILLSTGGPALRIVGRFDQYLCPTDERLEWQDWGTPWTDYHLTEDADIEALAAYVQQFYYGE